MRPPAGPPTLHPVRVWHAAAACFHTQRPLHSACVALTPPAGQARLGRGGSCPGIARRRSRGSTRAGGGWGASVGAVGHAPGPSALMACGGGRRNRLATTCRPPTPLTRLPGWRSQGDALCAGEGVGDSPRGLVRAPAHARAPHARHVRARERAAPRSPLCQPRGAQPGLGRGSGLRVHRARLEATCAIQRARVPGRADNPVFRFWRCVRAAKCKAAAGEYMLNSAGARIRGRVTRMPACARAA